MFVYLIFKRIIEDSFAVESAQGTASLSTVRIDLKTISKGSTFAARQQLGIDLWAIPKGFYDSKARVREI